MAGITATGFEILIQSEIHADLVAAAKTAFGTNAGTSDDEFFGRLFKVLSERYAVLWELAEAAYNAQDVDAAVDAALIAICALTGTLPLSPSPSLVTLTLTGADATAVAIGTQGSADGSLERFKTKAAATIVALAAWVGATTYSIGDRITNDGNAYSCTTAGVAAGSGGPTGEDSTTLEADGACFWRFLGVGVGAVDVASESVNNGAIVATALSITTIETTISGLQGMINLLDADLGQSLESNKTLRLRRATEIGNAGSATVPAARAKMLQVSGVTSARGFWNHTNFTDADSVPPHAVEFVIQGGTDQDILDGLLTAVGGGIETYGTTSGTALDAEGVSHNVAFSRADEQDVYAIVTITYDADQYAAVPADGDDLVAAAIVAFGDAQLLGKDSVAAAIAAQAFLVAGVHNVTSTLIGLSPSPATSATIPISLRQLAVYDTSRIIVNSSAVTP